LPCHRRTRAHHQVEHCYFSDSCYSMRAQTPGGKAKSGRGTLSETQSPRKAASVVWEAVGGWDPLFKPRQRPAIVRPSSRVDAQFFQRRILIPSLPPSRAPALRQAASSQQEGSQRDDPRLSFTEGLPNQEQQSSRVTPPAGGMSANGLTGGAKTQPCLGVPGQAWDPIRPKGCPTWNSKALQSVVWSPGTPGEPLTMTALERLHSAQMRAHASVGLAQHYSKPAWKKSYTPTIFAPM